MISAATKHPNEKKYQEKSLDKSVIIRNLNINFHHEFILETSSQSNVHIYSVSVNKYGCLFYNSFKVLTLHVYNLLNIYAPIYIYQDMINYCIVIFI